MKRFVRRICLLLSLVLLLALPAQAAGNARTSQFFTASAVYLHKTSSKAFEAWFEVTAPRTMDKIGASEIKIQRSTDDENWTTVATYSMSSYPSLIREDWVGHDACVSYTGSSGYYYRAYYKLYAKDESGTANWARYSSSLYIS